MRRPLAAIAVCLGLGLSGCLAPPPPAVQATDAARELNIAARFGRLDVAAGLASSAARREFLERRAGWGQTLRIVDTELAGFEMNEPTKATVYVDIAWVPFDEGTLRSTRVAQSWHEEDRGWALVRERRVAGDLGLFGEAVPRKVEPTRDVHFPSKTIR